MSIPLQISLINVNKSTFSADLFTNTKEILNGKLHFCAVLRANKIRLFISVQKQSSRPVLRKKFSENMQQLYRRRRMPKCDIEISPQHAWCPVNLLHILRKPFYKTTFGWLLLSVALCICCGFINPEIIKSVLRKCSVKNFVLKKSSVKFTKKRL